MLLLAAIGASRLAAPAPVRAQQPVKLSAVILAFLPDAGVPTRGLPWSSGDHLPVRWQSAKPVASADYLKQQGFTLSRTGTVRVALEGGKVQEATLQVAGNQLGVQQVSVSWNVLSGPFDGAARALEADGVSLKPLKCRREAEGASFGNVVHVAAAKGKQATGLWENWNCAHDGCGFGLTILYRRSALAQIECSGK
jgi:hypothetical protein